MSLSLASVLASVIVTGPARAAGPPAWGPIGVGIHPGVQTITEAAFCTANFVFHDAQGRVYLGQSAHCARKLLPEEAPAPTGCTFGSHPLGTPVQIGATEVRGTLAYSAWLTMQKRGETDPATCEYNDFALVEIPRFAHNQVNPTVPLFGGPAGLNTTGTLVGDLIAGYGDSPTRQDLSDLKPKQSVSAGTLDSGWAHLVYSVTPGIPGDSGGPYLDAQGHALGSLTALVLAPAAFSNSLTDIAKALAYAQAHSGIKGLTLAQGTAPFEGPLIGGPLVNQVIPKS